MYGIQVMTSTGQMPTDVLNTYGIVKVVNITSQTGSMTVPEFDSAIGFYHPIIENSVFIQQFSWNNSTKVLTWSKRPEFNSRTYSSDFLVYFFRGQE